MNHLSIQSLTFVHENCYTAQIDHKDILSFYEDERIIKITLTKKYEYEDSGFPRWSSIQPFDKDEITSMLVMFQDGETKKVYVPFKDVSTNGALCVNKKSVLHEDEYSITIEWKK